MLKTNRVIDAHRLSVKKRTFVGGGIPTVYVKCL